MQPPRATRSRKPNGFAVERARIRDLDLLIRHRYGMWAVIGKHPASKIRAHNRVYRAWLAPRLRTGRVVGFIARDPDGRALGSGCVWFMPDHPRPGSTQTEVPYVLSMFTEKGDRSRGVATAVLRAAIALARSRGYGRVVLHAAPMGRPIYERLGFEATPEMRLILAGKRRSTRTSAALRGHSKRKR